MKNIKTNVLRVLCLVGYGIFIGTALMQSFDAFTENDVLATVGKCGLGFGTTVMFVFLLNKDGKICSLKEHLLKKGNRNWHNACMQSWATFTTGDTGILYNVHHPINPESYQGKAHDYAGISDYRKLV